jgi:hypothetical protein
MLSKAYGEEAMNKCFKEGCKNMEDKRSGHPRSHRTDKNDEKCRIWCIQIDVQVSTKLIM